MDKVEKMIEDELDKDEYSRKCSPCKNYYVTNRAHCRSGCKKDGIPKDGRCPYDIFATSRLDKIQSDCPCYVGSGDNRRV